MSIAINSNYFSKNYYGYSSSLFSGFSSNNSFNTGSLIADYYTTKSASYRSLLKSYYSSDKVKKDTLTSAINKTNSKTTTESQKKALAIANDAASLTSAVDKLSKTNFNTSSDKDISKNVQSFVDAYNKVIDNVSESDNKTITQKGEWMAKQSKANTNLLSKVGITINTDNSLSFDSTKIKNNKNNLNSLFSKYQSFAYGVNYQSKQIYDVAAKESGSTLLSPSGYTSTGRYSPSSISSMLDTII